MKLLPIRRGEITRAQIRFSVVPVIRGIMNASSGAGSRARTKTAACGAANRGFESHPARFEQIAQFPRCDDWSGDRANYDKCKCKCDQCEKILNPSTDRVLLSQCDVPTWSIISQPTHPDRAQRQRREPPNLRPRSHPASLHSLTDPSPICRSGLSELLCHSNLAFGLSLNEE